MHTRPLLQADEEILRLLLMRAAEHNLFHLSALVEWGLPPVPDPYAQMWAVGAFRDAELVGMVGALRGTGGVYCTPGDEETLRALARHAVDRALGGPLSLLSGHEEQLGPLLPLVRTANAGQPEHCHFRTVRPGKLRLPSPGLALPDGFLPARIATEAEMERLVDFYMTGFYSLANLPSRTAWRARLAEQMRYRTLYIVEDEGGRVVSAAMSSAESGGGAMLGGVATLPEYVGRGLSTLCVGALCSYLFGKGMPLVSLFYLRENAPAARVYKKLGFQPSGDWILAALGVFQG